LVLFAELKPGALKLVAFGEDGFSGNRSQSVRKAVTEVQGSVMAAFAIFTEGHSCKISLVRINRNDFDAGFVKEEIEFASHGFGCAML